VGDRDRRAKCPFFPGYWAGNWPGRVPTNCLKAKGPHDWTQQITPGVPTCDLGRSSATILTNVNPCYLFTDDTISAAVEIEADYPVRVARRIQPGRISKTLSRRLPTYWGRIRRVTCGLRFPRRSMLIRPACSSLRSARDFASGWIPQSRRARLETITVSAFRRPLRYQSVKPTFNALTPRSLARQTQETSMGPLMNLPWIGGAWRP
jgi:hypothetical protein